MEEKIFLAIETSCDETSVAILQGNTLKSNIVSSQIKEHIQYGGVYPELASRLHTEKIDYLIDKAVNDANIEYKDIDYICVTIGPGLPGALHIGLVAAKTLAIALNKPLIGVHHLLAHLYANEYITKIQYPSLGVIISGGNTEIVSIKDPKTFEIIGETLDDAIGESFDKVARNLDIPYPGGVHIDRLVSNATSKNLIKYPKANIGGYDVSYSGLKSHIIRDIERRKSHNGALSEQEVIDIAYSTQVNLIGQLLNKVELAIQDTGVKQVIFGGGVSANSYLRNEVEKIKTKYADVEFVFPPLWCTTDNAAMIALTGKHLVEQGYETSLDTPSFPSLDIQPPYIK